jgi:imidazoleglycerol-phosphate dehydratase
LNEARLSNACYLRAAVAAQVAKGDSMMDVKAQSRSVRIERQTLETQVRVHIALDGRGEARILTGIGFFDHMLELFARHGLFDLEVECRGDLQVDDHHSIEDVGIALGQAFAQALGEKKGIARYGEATVPMDEALCRAVVDLSGRAYFVYNLPTRRQKIGNFSVEMAEHFWRSFAHEARCNLHIDLLRGRNTHHVLEACFKAVARALRRAVELDPRVPGVPSTKGVL